MRVSNGQIMYLSEALGGTVDTNGKPVKFTQDKTNELIYNGTSTDNFTYSIEVEKPKVTFSVVKQSGQKPVAVAEPDYNKEAWNKAVKESEQPQPQTQPDTKTKGVKRY